MEAELPKELWQEWELRVLVLLSLTVQVLLIVLGRHRKYRPNLWLQALVWSLYLSADAIAIYALGKIATRFAQMRRDLSAAATTAGLDPDAQMIAFWTPFLLLHLGGPDTITAYSLEDNELWLRHLLRLVVQMVGTLLIFFQALTGSDLSVLSLLIFVSSLIKYGERVYVLRAASSEQFRNSTLDPPLRCPRILEEYIIEERDSSRSILKDKSFHVVFRVIEIELGLMYDLLYTKAMVFHHNRWGSTLRSVSILLTVTVLVIFSMSDKDKYSKINIYVTFLLLSFALFLEIYSLFYLLFSNQAACWLKDRSPAILNFVERLQPLYNRRRWSGSMGQYNLLSFAIKEKHLACHQNLRFLHVDQKVLKFLYEGDVKVTDFLKERVIQHLTSQRPSVWEHRGHFTIRKHPLRDRIKWSIDLGFDQSILAWHIATELLGCSEAEHATKKTKLYMEMSEQLSRYMVYLLVMYPFLLPIGVGRVKFRDTYLEARNFFEEKAIKGNDRPESKSKIAKACEALRECVDPKVAPIVAEGDKSKFALHHGCRLAWQLDEGFKQWEEEKWWIISRVWVEMLAYAAVKCKGLHHAQQLPQGGEFLTHVWLLMAHFGLNEHFQIPQAPAIAELLVQE
ncbi:hypothetical protein EUGRSUZ_J02754 [Eucalyptus grandis]|uniref:DUF4220 domain-containing protein n=2 Tax=Eucalyptus grandis TaxID=71139 RepID=A0A059AID6_EUCGR|nr:hypothetical protein EUGRSUZ_J02754 [Eucalyptus grandis]